MAVKTISGKQAPENGDSLAEKIRDSILGIENLRAENLKLTDQINSLETTNLKLETEVRSLTSILEQERAERQHYHSFANEIITRLGVVGQTIADVVKRAELESIRQRKEKPRADLPPPEMPASLKKAQSLREASEFVLSERRSHPSAASANDEREFLQDDISEGPRPDGET
ncbi:MAG TPA: hypothetical protein VH684_30290 [Xanthobacteraceae bacterium]|jgi:hypothetical protein